MRAVSMFLAVLEVSPLYGSETAEGEAAFAKRLENTRRALAAMREAARPPAESTGPANGAEIAETLPLAAKIASVRARPHSLGISWRYVKTALLEAKAVNGYPKTVNAKEAGDDLVQNHGFQRLNVTDPYDAPVGAVIVYGGQGEGHVELRNPTGFVSDFASATPSPRPMSGVFFKPAEARGPVRTDRRVASIGSPLYLGPR